jgi:hypothetical protein
MPEDIVFVAFPITHILGVDLLSSSWENVSLPWEKLDEDGNELLEVKESVSDW